MVVCTCGSRLSVRIDPNLMLRSRLCMPLAFGVWSIHFPQYHQALGNRNNMLYTVYCLFEQLPVKPWLYSLPSESWLAWRASLLAAILAARQRRCASRSAELLATTSAFRC